MNLSRAWVTSARAKLDVGDVDREELVYRVEEDELRSDPPRAGAEADDGFITGKMSNPISSIGSILQDVARQAEHVTLDSTVPRKRRKGYSVSSIEEPWSSFSSFLMDEGVLSSLPTSGRALLQLFCIASINKRRNS